MKMPVDRFDIELIKESLNSKEYATCLKRIKKVEERLGNLTGWLHWASGICEDCLGNPFQGLLHFKSALATDPYNYDYHLAMSENMDYFRHTLKSYLDGAGTLEDIEKVHRLLVEAGEFSSTLQYLVIRNYIVREQYTKAQELLAVFLMNNPRDDEAMELEKIVSKHTGKMHMT